MAIRTQILTAVALALLAAFPAAAWGPRTQAAIVSTAMNLLSKNGDAPLIRLSSEIKAGAAVSVSDIELSYPDLANNPLQAVESEMALLAAMRQSRVDAYYAYRMGVLGKVVAMITSPMRGAQINYRNQYNEDSDKAINGVQLRQAPRKEVDPRTYFQRVFLEAQASEEMILKQYQDGMGFKGVAASTFPIDASRSVAAVCDVWWTVLSSRTVPGGVSEVQMQRYVLEAYAFFIGRRNEKEIDLANAQYGALAPITPDMRAKIGDLLLESGFQDRAIREYEAVMAAAPDRRDVVQKVSDFYVAKGDAALQENKLEEARADFEKAAKANPLHGSAESKRLQAENLILERDGRLAAQQAAIQSANDMRDLAEQEAQKNRYAEAIALLGQAEAAYKEVTEEFPNEFQQRTRGERDVQNRTGQFKEALTANASSYSGTGSATDPRELVAAGSKGLEQDALRQIVKNQLKLEMDKLSERLQSGFTMP
jgi:tetratricopeptide (TPR) repeat protein